MDQDVVAHSSRDEVNKNHTLMLFFGGAALYSRLGC